jgi:peptidoglycan hydrolase-like protein with peptidoglycan-binding domain
VTAFQAAKGLTQDGIAGAATLTAINTALSAG